MIFLPICSSCLTKSEPPTIPTVILDCSFCKKSLISAVASSLGKVRVPSTSKSASIFFPDIYLTYKIFKKSYHLAFRTSQVIRLSCFLLIHQFFYIVCAKTFHLLFESILQC